MVNAQAVPGRVCEAGFTPEPALVGGLRVELSAGGFECRNGLVHIVHFEIDDGTCRNLAGLGRMN